MAEAAHNNVAELAEQLVEGFAALSGEYQALFDQQKQLDSKLSWAKHQVCDEFFYPSFFYDEKLSSRPAAALAALTENNHMYTSDLGTSQHFSTNQATNHQADPA
jgi:hypothetical protein